MNNLWRLIFLASLGVVPAGWMIEIQAADDVIDFNRDIRGILSNACYKCHGPDEQTREAALRLDDKDNALGPLESAGHAIVPGNVASSVLFQRITSSDKSERMPPADSGKNLTDAQIELIKKWIEQGAAWRGHWSFIAPQRPEPPQVAREDLVKNPIDRFIQSRLEREGLSPSDEADKLKLIRRVTFDLTGLPPTLAEIDAFIADTSPDAYENLVDRLLSSSRYGEHMTRYWLDVARYGDTHGLHLDNMRQIWPYRDWLIRAFNDNMPFDQFTVEQLAGDLLPDATVDQQVASGFNRCNVTTSEGGSIAEEYRVRYAIDRVETTATVWLGLTAGCAVCHEHKFDPLSQTEFYRLYAYFYNFAEREMDGNALLPQGPTIAVASDTQRIELKSLNGELAIVGKSMKARAIGIDEQLAKWEEQTRLGEKSKPSLPVDTILHVPFDEGSGNEPANLSKSEHRGKVEGNAAWTDGKSAGAFAFDGKTHIVFGDLAGFERTDSFSYGAWVRTKNESAQTVLSRLDDGSLHRGFDMYLGSGLVYIHIIHAWDKNAIRLNTKAKLKVNEWQHVMMTYDGSSKAEGVAVYIDGKPAEVVITHNSLNGTIKTPKPLTIGRRTPGAPMNGAIDDVRIYPRRLTTDEVAAIAGLNPIVELLAIPADKRSAEQKNLIQDHYLSSFDDKYKEFKNRRGAIEQQIAAINAAIPQTMIMGDRPDKQPVYRLIRGQYEKPDTTIALEPNVPAALPPLANDAPPNRLALGQWLVSRENPLTARVTVNRLWQQLFGTGLVKTAEDFGSQGEWPSHPELLDWLSVNFMDNGWNVKRMVKSMVMSHSYRQSSAVTKQMLERDKSNRLLARGPRFRLDAEVIRDSALFVGGLLVEQQGGPSVRPYQPSGLWEAVGYTGSNTVRFTQDHGESLYRRSMYIFWKRTAPPPTMQIFDSPSREYCVMRRERTNTPASALVLMNDVQFVEASRKLAERILTQPKQDDQERFAFAYRTVLARPPTDFETDVLSNVLKKLRATYQSDKDAATKLVGVGESPRNEQLDVSELATWTMIASLIMNLDEAITKG